MGSGDSDIADTLRERLARSGSLDAYVRCTVEGCEVRVHISAPAPVRCRPHGGERVPQYETSATDGSFIWAAFMAKTPGDIEAGGDCE